MKSPSLSQLVPKKAWGLTLLGKFFVPALSRCVGKNIVPALRMGWSVDHNAHVLAARMRSSFPRESLTFWGHLIKWPWHLSAFDLILRMACAHDDTTFFGNLAEILLLGRVSERLEVLKTLFLGCLWPPSTPLALSCSTAKAVCISEPPKLYNYALRWFGIWFSCHKIWAVFLKRKKRK